MSDILASIRKIMAQDPESSGPAIVKPTANGADAGPRPGMRLPAPDAPREQAKPATPAPAPAPASVSAAPLPSAKPAPDMPAAADEPISLDEFLAMAAPPRDVVTMPISVAPAAAAAKPVVSSAPASASAASVSAQSGGNAPDWLFPRAQSTDAAKGDAAREPEFGTAPAAARPASAPQGPSLASPRPAGSSTPAPKADMPQPNTPMAGPAPAPVKAPSHTTIVGPVPARGAPPAPKMLGDLGSVVPSRFGNPADGTSRRIAGQFADGNDRYSPASTPSPGPAQAVPSRVEATRAAPDPAPAFEPEIPGADALRRLIAGVVPPSALAPSARAPAPNADYVRTEVVLPVQATVPQAAPAAKPLEAAPAAKPL
ncbi:MAG: hypothetical protein ABI391_02900, partial [Hyphomicrobiaceae bacterium]